MDADKSFKRLVFLLSRLLGKRGYKPSEETISLLAETSGVPLERVGEALSLASECKASVRPVEGDDSHFRKEVVGLRNLLEGRRGAAILVDSSEFIRGQCSALGSVVEMLDALLDDSSGRKQ